jgi:hypothetical protein
VLVGALFVRGRNRRNLASAFVGEITAVMETVEEHPDIKRLSLVQSIETDTPPEFGELHVPKPTIYEMNVGQLLLFDAPLPRELSYFYTRLMGLPGRLRALRRGDPSSAEDVKRRTDEALADIAHTMNLGENLLRSLRKYVSRRQPDSISRA